MCMRVTLDETATRSNEMAVVRAQMAERIVSLRRIRRAFHEADLAGATDGRGVCRRIVGWEQRFTYRNATAGTGRLDVHEVDEALRFAGVFLPVAALRDMEKVLDDGHAGLSVDRVIAWIRGVPSSRRASHAAKTARTLGASSIAEIVRCCQPERHPTVQRGRCTEADVLADIAEELVVASSGRVDSVDEAALADALLATECAALSDDAFSAILEQCWGVPEAELTSSDTLRLASFISLMRAAIDAKKALHEVPAAWFKRTCRHFDMDECGALTLAQLTALLRVVGLPLTQSEARLVFDRVVHASSGRASCEALVHLVCSG